MKKLLTFLVCFVLMIGSIGLTACGTNDTKQSTESNTGTDKPITQLSVQSVSAPKLGGKTLTAYSTRSGQTGISKRLSATVSPSSAQNKLVDYRLFWLGEGEHASEPVTDYVVVEQDSDGSTDATVTCIQAFGDDTIIIQVVTRDGGYTAECVVTYAGFISEMSITSPTLNTVNTTERGDYYELFTNQTYTFNVNLDNALHSVGTYDLSVETSGVGEFYFFDKVVYEQFGARGAFSPAGWYPEKIMGGNLSKGPELYALSNIVNKFIDVSISNNIITVTVKSKELSNYYEEVSEEYREFAYDTSWIMYSSTATPSPRLQNEQNLPSAYFTITVTDSVTDISETIKIWVEASVNGVSLSAQNLEF